MAALLITTSGGMFVGFNSYKTHPLAKKFQKNKDTICLHAEVDAIRKAVSSGASTEGSKMFVARVLKNGKAALAKPCTGCQRALVAFGVEKVEWTI